MFVWVPYTVVLSVQRRQIFLFARQEGKVIYFRRPLSKCMKMISDVKKLAPEENKINNLD